MGKDMIDLIGVPATYELLAEECCELAKEALKMARIIRGENPTPKEKEEVAKNLVEEVSDIKVCLDELKIHEDHTIMADKIKRFHKWWAESGRDGGLYSPKEKFPYVIGQPAEIFMEGVWRRGKIVEGYRFKDGVVTVELEDGSHAWCGVERTDIYRQVEEVEE